MFICIYCISIHIHSLINLIQSQIVGFFEGVPAVFGIFKQIGNLLKFNLFRYLILSFILETFFSKNNM